ncbi:MAG: helix-hairpin-helix domain-containing protein [Nitrospinae bacterium]|nr:helix-hairpin-helix domain-containing protein [Nitrospinota bacterium]
MIRQISGEIIDVDAECVILKTSAGIAYEIQVGGYAVHELQALMGAREAVELHTHHYLEGNVATGQLLPRLVGFLSAEERAFFLSFIKVPGISPKSGVRAMSLPPLQIAEAIATANATLLTKLPGIGRKKAEQVISTLREEIAELHLTGDLAPPSGARQETTPLHGDVMAVLVGQLGYRTPEAENLVERAVAELGADAEAEAILQEVFRLSR